MKNRQPAPWTSVIYTFVLVVLPLVISSVMGVYVIRYEPQIAAFSPFVWGIFYAVSVPTMAFGLMPTTLVALLSGYFLGWGSVVPVVVGYLLASALGYGAARRIDGGQLMAFLQTKPRVRELIRRLRREEFRMIFFARLSPALPFAASNVVFSCAGVSLRRLLVASLLGMAPRMLITVGVGTQGSRLRELIDDPAGIEPHEWALLALLLISLAGMGWVVRRAIRERYPDAA